MAKTKLLKRQKCANLTIKIPTMIYYSYFASETNI